MLNGKNYCISKENIAAHELIGLNATILESPDKKKQGIKGKVIDETKNLLVLETKNGLKQLPKKECIFEFELGNEKALVSGKSILEKPENRIKNFKVKKNAV